MPQQASPKSGRKRTRTGCQRCRVRRIKCDESKPVCRQCQAKGFKCQPLSTLKWEDEYNSRGLAFGRSGVWSKGPLAAKSPDFTGVGLKDTLWCDFPPIHAYSFVNTTFGRQVNEDLALIPVASTDPKTWHLPLDSQSGHHDQARVEFVDSDDVLEPNALISMRLGQLRKEQASTTMNISPPPSFLSLDALQSTLLTYYIQKLCPLTVPSPLSKSPFATLILPFSISKSSAVLNSILALAASHRARQDATFKPTALRLCGNVLRYLSRRMGMTDTNEIALDPETLVITMMLCLMGIIRDCDERWVVHLKGARDLIRLRRQALLSAAPQSQSSLELVGFSERFFAYQDIIGRTACGEEPIFDGDFWVAHWTSNNTDAWLGCSPELVSILCEITELSRQRSRDPAVATSDHFLSQAFSLEDRLGRLEQRVLDPEDDILQTTAELKRLSAVLYLDCAIRGAQPRSPRVTTAVTQILRLVFVLLERDVTAGLAWSIFVAAVELDPLEDLVWTMETKTSTVPRHGRNFVLFALDKMAGSSVSNISQTRSVIEKVWQSRDLDVLPDGCHGRNDWEQHVAPFCHGLSLG
ncbi:hypothetical protein J7T55_004985 [Diaporthe amygdali]|uniref:uncharacterized protein n=1 Tax=Phomopsis amygdali TaxID=1214568 RepID=UPI0022FDB559|nr:uncharacterized protein J7T55_004985 [Diaporthe amygdali]KAJ0116040.1 hypothetical protein J7T55_004985 [Diaporthe amygdali]